MNSLYIGKENESFTINEICRLAKNTKTDVLHLHWPKNALFENDISTSENTKIKLKITEDIYMTTYAFQIGFDDTPWRTNPRICKDDQSTEVQFEDAITRRAYVWTLTKIQNEIPKK